MCAGRSVATAAIGQYGPELLMVAVPTAGRYAYDAYSSLRHNKRERAGIPWIDDCAISASYWYSEHSSARL